MCKYCNLEYIEETGEKLNGNVSINEIKDGCHIFELSINRYIDTDCDIHTSELVIDMSVVINDLPYTVKDKYIKIKYCPFCGEEL